MSNANTTILPIVKQLEIESNALITRINEERTSMKRLGQFNHTTIRGWINKLTFFTEQLRSLHFRCENNLYNRLKSKYEHISQSSNITPNPEPTTFYKFLDMQQIPADWNSVNNIIDNLIININTFHEDKRTIIRTVIDNILNKVFATPQSKENYDAYLKGEQATKALEITDRNVVNCIKKMLDECEKTKSELYAIITPSFSKKLSQIDSQSSILTIDII